MYKFYTLINTFSHDPDVSNDHRDHSPTCQTAATAIGFLPETRGGGVQGGTIKVQTCKFQNLFCGLMLQSFISMNDHLQSAQLRIVGHAVLCEYKSITRMRTDTKKRARGLKANDNLNSRKKKAQGRKK